MARRRHPDWEKLQESALAQDGHFSLRQALDAGFSAQLITYHVQAGNFERVLRGVFRLHPYPHGEHDELVAIGLWAGDDARFSHETVLALHQLSDALPARVHVTVPASWRRRRIKAPKLVVLHYRDASPKEIDWYGALRITTVHVTIQDCIDGHVDPILVRQAIAQARQRGLITADDAKRFRRLHLAAMRKGAA